ncbi:hypothetical protein [Stenotrophomonas cyclobalanopsidis]
MNDEENDTPDCPRVDFPPLLDWDEVLQMSARIDWGLLGARRMRC